jgi:hypothetical protein
MPVVSTLLRLSVNCDRSLAMVRACSWRETVRRVADLLHRRRFELAAHGAIFFFLTHDEGE